MNIPLSIILGGVSKRRDVTLLCPHRVYRFKAILWDRPPRECVSHLGRLLDSEAGQLQGLDLNETKDLGAEANTPRSSWGHSCRLLLTNWLKIIYHFMIVPFILLWIIFGDIP